MASNIIEFQHREPIGSSTFPMPGCDPDFAYVKHALSVPEQDRITSTLYLHIPFCDRICSFCGFSKSVGDEAEKDAYVKALKREIEMYAETPYVASLSIKAVYLGGGTPNCLSPEQLTSLLSCVRRYFPLSEDCEITVEGILPNFTDARIEALKLNGVNRISTGVQTLNRQIRSQHLHMQDGLEEIEPAIAKLRNHFDNFNLDFIYNLPQQTDAIWHEDVHYALTAGSTHLTFYPLVLLERTGLYSDYVKTGKHSPPDEELEIKQFNFVRDEVARSAFSNHYSVRDWALPGRECRYIMLNAEANHVLALGASSHGYIAGFTYRNEASISKYIDTVNNGQFPLLGMRVSTLEERMQRYMVMGC